MSNRQAAQVRYAFRTGAQIKGAKPDAVAGELTRIATERGGISAPVLVEESKPAGAALHPCFEWHDKKAGALYREHQARQIIKSVTVIKDDRPPAPLITYCPEVATQDDQPEPRATDYKLTDVVVSRPDYYAQALSELVRRVRSAKDAVEQLQQAAQQEGEQDAERLARINMAVAALQTASSAVMALH